MRGAGVGLIEGLQVEHFLVGGGGFRQPALLHERVAQQPVVQHDGSSRDERAGELFRFAESMELMKYVTAQQQGCGLVRIPSFEARGRFLGERVVAGVVAHPGACDVEVSEPLERGAIVRR